VSLWSQYEAGFIINLQKLSNKVQHILFTRIYTSLNCLTPSGKYMCHLPNIQKLCILITECFYMLSVILIIRTCEIGATSNEQIVN